jgi:hypothetical protein
MELESYSPPCGIYIAEYIMILFIGHNFAQDPKKDPWTRRICSTRALYIPGIFFKDSLKLEYSYLQA